MTKICPECGLKKPIDNFVYSSRSGRAKTEHRVCLKCFKERKQAYWRTYNKKARAIQREKNAEQMKVIAEQLDLAIQRRVERVTN